MRDDIEVETHYTAEQGVEKPHSAVITDRKSQRAWSGEGETCGKAVTEATKKFLGDRRAKEYVGD